MINISVGMCTYNGEKYIREQLSSIFNQSKKVDEIVICDDCSNDNTISIIKEFQEKYPNTIRLYQNESNIGFGSNFFKCFSLCKGEYIFSCDQDDVWCENKVEKIIDAFKYDTVFVFSNAYLIDGEGNELNKSLWESLQIDYKKICNNEEYKKTIKKQLFVSGTTMAFKNSFYKKVGIPKYICSHDIYLSYLAPLFGSVVAIDEKLTKYRRHNNNTTKNAPVRFKDTTTRRKMSLSYRIKDNWYWMRHNGKYYKYSAQRNALDSVYEISKNYNNEYAMFFNDKSKFLKELDEISKKKKLSSLWCFIKFISKKENRDIYKKYQHDEIMPMFKDFLYMLLAN